MVAGHRLVQHRKYNSCTGSEEVHAMLRIVPHGQRLVLLRDGNVVAVKGPGLVFFLPGIHRVVSVPVRPTRLDILWVRAATSDGVEVTANASLLLTVEDPAAYAQLPEPPDETVQAVVDARLRRYIAESDLVAISRATEGDRRRLTGDMTAQIHKWGIRAEFLELTHMQVEVDAGLVRWADNQSAAVAAEPYTNRSTNPTSPVGGQATMDVTRTTVPGTGTVHRYVTHGGQQFGVLLDKFNRRRLLVYGSTDLDVPRQTIVLEQEEADQLADLLHSKPIADRVADLERRFSELAAQVP